VPVRQCVLSVPTRLRHHLQHDCEALNSALRIFLDAIEHHLRGSLGASTQARTGAVAFIHRFGSALNEHTHFHVVVIDGVFKPDPEQGVRFIATQTIAADAVRVVQTQVRRRNLRAFVRRGRINAQTRKEMEAWDHGSGFSLDASVRSRPTTERAWIVCCATAPVLPSPPSDWRISTRSGCSTACPNRVQTGAPRSSFRQCVLNERCALWPTRCSRAIY